MSKLVTLATLRSDAQLMANQRSSAFLTDTDWNRLLNQAATEFYDLIVQARGHEAFEKVATLATSVNSAIVALPADWYQTITILANWGAQQLEELQSLDHLGDQTDYRNWNQWAQYSPKAWRMRGALIEFFPTPTSVTQLELRYIPAFQDLTGDASTLDGQNGWDELISSAAAMKALDLQGLPSAGAEKVYQRVRERVEQLAGERAAANPPTIRDVYGGAEGRQWWGRLPWPVA